MTGEKRFGGSLFGFNKTDVNTYIEKMLKEFDDKLKENEEEISSLKNQNRELKTRYEELARKAEQINEDRVKIADVLIKAEEKGQLIIEDARLQAIKEKKNLEELIEREKEKLVDIKQELKVLKEEVVSTLRKYEGQLNVILDNSEDSRR